jgi:pilus assembly protein Flp/PilA
MNLINDQSGVTAIEYALIAALIAVAAIAAFTLVGTNLSNTFSYVASQLYGAAEPRRAQAKRRRTGRIRRRGPSLRLDRIWHRPSWTLQSSR